MNAEYTIGRINFGPRDSFTTLGQLIDEIAAQEELVDDLVEKLAAQEELVDDLCLFAGELLTQIELLKECQPPVTEPYEL